MQHKDFHWEWFHSPLKLGETPAANSLPAEKTESCQVYLEGGENFVSCLIRCTLTTCGSWPEEQPLLCWSPYLRPKDTLQDVLHYHTCFTTICFYCFICYGQITPAFASNSLTVGSQKQEEGKKIRQYFHERKYCNFRPHSYWKVTEPLLI